MTGESDDSMSEDLSESDLETEEVAGGPQGRLLQLKDKKPEVVVSWDLLPNSLHDFSAFPWR